MLYNNTLSKISNLPLLYDTFRQSSCSSDKEKEAKKKISTKIMNMVVPIILALGVGTLLRLNLHMKYVKLLNKTNFINGTIKTLL